MKRFLLLALAASFTLTAAAQEISVDEDRARRRHVATVSTLPSCGTGTKGWFYAVTDGANATDCSTGGGSTYVICDCDGSSWTSIATGGSGVTDHGALTGLTDDDHARYLDTSADDTFSESTYALNADTSVASDTYTFTVSAGGGTGGSASRGAFWRLGGNNAAGGPDVYISAGDGADGDILILNPSTSTSNISIQQKDASGTFSTLTLASGLTFAPFTGCSTCDFNLEDGVDLELHDATSTYSVEVKSSDSMSASWDLTLPTDDGNSGEALTTNGSGVSDWTALPNSFETMNAPAGTDPVADSTSDTLNWAATSPITITGDSSTDTLTVACPTCATTDGIWTEGSNAAYYNGDGVAIGADTAPVKVDGAAGSLQVQGDAEVTGGQLYLTNSGTSEIIAGGDGTTANRLDIETAFPNTGVHVENAIVTTPTARIAGTGTPAVSDHAVFDVTLNTKNTDDSQTLATPMLQVGGTTLAGDGGGVFAYNLILEGSGSSAPYEGNIVFEGATNDTVETFIRVTDPTSTDKVVTIPDATGEMSLLGQTIAISELATGTDGELITWDASGNPAAVSTGTSGHVLTSNGAGTAPTFQAASGGSMPYDYARYDAASLYCAETANCATPYEQTTAPREKILRFDASTDEYANGKYWVTDDLDTSGTVEFAAYVKPASHASANVELCIEEVEDADGEDRGGTYNAECSGAVAVSASSGVWTEVVWTETVTNLGWAAGDLVRFRIYRDVSPNDTLSGDLELYSVRIRVPQA